MVGAFSENEGLANVLLDSFMGVVLVGEKHFIGIPPCGYVDHLFVGDGEIVEGCVEGALADLLAEVMLDLCTELLKC